MTMINNSPSSARLAPQSHQQNASAAETTQTNVAQETGLLKAAAAQYRDESRASRSVFEAALQAPNVAHLPDHIAHRIKEDQSPYRDGSAQDLKNSRIDTARTAPDAQTAISNPEYGFKITDAHTEAALRAAAGNNPTRYRDLVLVSYLYERLGASQARNEKDFMTMARQAGCTTITEKDLKFVRQHAESVYDSIDLLPKYRGVHIPDDIKPLISREATGGPSLSSEEINRIVSSGIVKTRFDGYQNLKDLYPRSAKDYKAAAALLSENDISFTLDQNGRPIITDSRVSEEAKKAWAQKGS